MTGVNVCFVDFDYPTGCETWSIFDTVTRIVSDTGANVTQTCMDSLWIESLQTMASCDIVLGVADGTYDSFVYGPTYNSSKVGALIVPTMAVRARGWDFMNPFSWSVWVVFVGCAIVAFCTQLLMRWLDFRRKQTSPNFVIDEDEEHASDVVLTSFTALIGSTRLYRRYDGPYLRQISSMVMALFSVFFVSLYSSNLTAFLFPNTQPNLVPGMTFSVSLDVYRTVQLPPGAVKNVMVSLTGPTASTSVVAPVLWLGGMCRKFSFIPLEGFVTYSVLYRDQHWTRITRRIVDVLSNQAWPGPACFVTRESTARLAVVDVWGLFVITGVFYIGVLVARCLGKKSLRFQFVKKTPEIDATPRHLTTELSMRPCDSGDIDMFGVLENVT